METSTNISFEDTSVAFSAKTNRDLRKANFLFSIVKRPWMNALATGAANLSLNIGLPVKGIIKNTVFAHFCGGESIEECQKAVENLGEYGIGAILDYSVEGATEEVGFEKTTQEILDTIAKAATTEHIPFSVFKMTGIASTPLLEKVQAGLPLTDAEMAAFKKVEARVERICRAGFEADVPVLIDAEESWIQDPIDKMAYAMMKEFNKKKAIVYNTYQMYRVDMLDNLKRAFHYAAMDSYFLGAKLVRGAYMEKERARAEEKVYPSPIHPNKEATDESFNKALSYCMDNKQRIHFMCGSHNEYSNYYLTLLMDKHSMKNNNPGVWFAQLYGMSDNISFNLAQAGYNVAKYVPYGPVKAVMPYLIRRADENTSVGGQSSRELALIRKELKRRKGK